ncbi:MAG: hypothetical protein IJP68_00585 [Selenomonadaceae bacterium]|nr:hypothetical protein [Selenomonadaceae bacterium]
MKLYPDSKVCILCPGNFYTGGTELCHQLASKLLSMNIQAYIFYIPMLVYDKFDKNAPVHDALKKYHVPYAFALEDEPQNILIGPETSAACLYSTKETQRVIWWMSVDNYILNIISNLQGNLKTPLAKPLLRFFQFGETDSDIEHFVQSEYARQFLKLNGVPDDKIHWVEDYLGQEFLDGAAQVDLSCKKNIVAFNPKKGFEVTKILMKLAPDIDWRPIEKMTPAQVQELLAESKVYIDFGAHPGKDRIPREAAISGCVVITNKKGAAANDVDINIPDEFKFDESSKFDAVIKKIREVFENFEAAHEKQAAYRARILDDKNRFDKEVEELFAPETQPPLSIALTQGVGEKSALLAEEFFQEFSQSGLIKPSFIVDDTMATENAAELLPEIIIREQNRNYLRVEENFIEIITRDDAKFLYREGRINKFALLEPDAAQIDDLKNFYEADDDDILIFNN